MPKPSIASQAQQKNTSSRLSDKELKLGYWYVSHKLLLKKLLLVCLILFDIFFVGFGAWGFLDYYVIKKDYDIRLQQSAAENLVNYQLFYKKHPVLPLEIAGVQVVGGSFGKYDFLAKVYNRNKDWYAKKVVYHFEFSGAKKEDLMRQETSFLPNQEKFLFELGVASDSKAVSANLVIQEIQWQRLGSIGIRDFDSYYRERMNMAISEVEFIPSSELIGKIAKVPMSRVRFKSTNRSSYNFWEVGYLVLLGRQEKILSANYITDTLIKSGETRELFASFFEKLPVSAEVMILPDLDILDERVYMEFEKGVGERK